MEFIKVDLIIVSDSDDVVLHFISPALYDEMKWTQDEIEIGHNNKHIDRVWEVLGEALEKNDSRIIQSVYSQAYTDGEDINQKYLVNRVMNLMSE